MRKKLDNYIKKWYTVVIRISLKVDLKIFSSVCILGTAEKS